MSAWFRVVAVCLAVAAGVWFGIRPSRDGLAVDATTIVTGERVKPLEATHRAVGFPVLAGFTYEPPRVLSSASPRSSVPDSIRALNGQHVAVDGFMLPLDFDGTGVGQFVLNASYDMCAFGAPSMVNERIEVTMTRGRRTIFTHHAIRVFGRLTVEDKVDGDEVVGLYRLDAEAIGPPGMGY